MVVRVNPQNAVPNQFALDAQALKNEQMKFLMDRDMIDSAQKDMSGVMDFIDRKAILNDMQSQAQQLGAGGQQAKQGPQVDVSVQQDEILESGGLVDEETEANFSSLAEKIEGASDADMQKEIINHAQKGLAEGRDMSDTIEIAGKSPQEQRLAIGNINQMIQNKNVRRMMARNPEGAKDFLTTLGVGQQTGLSEEAKLRLKEDSKVREELRGDLRSRFVKFDENLTGLETNYVKVANLSKNIKGNNRMAVAQGLIGLVKLGDPNSAVLTAEMEAALNLQSPTAILAQIKDLGISGLMSDDNLNKALATIDPLKPENVDTDSIMDVANSLIGAQVGSLNSGYAQSKELGMELGGKGIKSIFTQGRENRLKKLNKIGEKAGINTVKQSNPPTGKYVAGKTYTDSDGNSAVYQSDGTWKEL